MIEEFVGAAVDRERARQAALLARAQKARAPTGRPPLPRRVLARLRRRAPCRVAARVERPVGPRDLERPRW